VRENRQHGLMRGDAVQTDGVPHSTLYRTPQGSSVVAEVYPALWNRHFPSAGRNSHQHDAYTVARWMRAQDSNHHLINLLLPRFTPTERTLAETEGWILSLD
jgi:hypothetical protein